MKNFKNKSLIWLFAMPFSLLLFISLFSSCSEDHDAPIITGVRKIEKADSLFKEAYPGQMIVVVGQNFYDVTNLYINNRSVSYNTNYVTPTSIIVTIPKTITTVGEDPSLPAQIRLETEHGIATYDFHVNSPAPELTGYTVEYNSAGELEPGQDIEINGKNIYEVQEIYLSETYPSDNLDNSADPLVKHAITDYMVNESHTAIKGKLPQTLIDRGYLVVKCWSTRVVLDFRRKRPVEPTITEIYPESPVLGEKVTIKGKDLTELDHITLGNNEYLVWDAVTNEDATEITFDMPIASVNQETLTVVLETGEKSMPFCQKKYMLIDFDTFGEKSWGGTDLAKYDYNTELSYAPAGSGRFVGLEGTSAVGVGWFGPMVLGSVNDISTDIIPAETPISKIQIRFEYYVGEPLLPGTVLYVKYPDGVEKAYDFATDETGKWCTFSAPLSDLTDKTTYGEFATIFSYSAAWNINNAEAVNVIRFYADNLRLYVEE